VHPFATFRTKKKATQLLGSDRQGLGYVTPSARSDSGTEESLPSHSSDSSSWELDSSMGVVFKNFFANITSISQAEYDEDTELFNTDPWAQKLDLHWKKRFEQREPSTEDKVVQVDVGDRGETFTKK